jgi:hypothetical protein
MAPLESAPNDLPVLEDRSLKVISFINAHKILVPPIVLGMMWYFANWSTEAFVYLSLHGTYSVLWLIKEVLYPDRRFLEKQPMWFGMLFIFLPLAAYYIAPYLLKPPPSSRAICHRPCDRSLHARDLPALRQRRTEVLHTPATERSHRGRPVWQNEKSELSRRNSYLYFVRDPLLALAAVCSAQRLGRRIFLSQYAGEGSIAVAASRLRCVQIENRNVASKDLAVIAYLRPAIAHSAKNTPRPQ